ncbi:MAG: sigma-70 family RNA polymerase sigma factor [Saprospiraceae bacterium]|nr:sigma-70 family RNA polymerase sigma factor [Saprospiraceae bacterium]
MTEEDLIKGCKANDRKAQKALYDQYGPILMAICKRYVRQTEDAEDVLLEAFYKIFSNINQYEGKGSFEGWMKRISVNESLMFLRKRHNFNISLESNHLSISSDEYSVEEQLFESDILDVLDTLPTGYRTVFNLYVIDGMKHREIAEELGISINTSKSQLIQAKRRLASLLKKNKISAVG